MKFRVLCRAQPSAEAAQAPGAHLDKLSGDAHGDLRRGLPTNVKSDGQMDGLDLLPGEAPALQLPPQEGFLLPAAHAAYIVGALL